MVPSAQRLKRLRRGVEGVRGVLPEVKKQSRSRAGRRMKIGGRSKLMVSLLGGVCLVGEERVARWGSPVVQKQRGEEDRGRDSQIKDLIEEDDGGAHGD